jgi:hypothetical protein
VVASTEDADLKDTKRIRFPQKSRQERRKDRLRKKQVARQSHDALLWTLCRGGAWTIIAILPFFALAA